MPTSTREASGLALAFSGLLPHQFDGLSGGTVRTPSAGDMLCREWEGSMATLTVSRRRFIGSVAGGLTLSTLARPTVSAWRPGQVPAGPNDQIVLGMIGVGRQGTSRLREFLKQPDTRIAAISDVDRDHLDRAVAEVEKIRGQKPKAFADFRRVLDDREIDAVVVVTPDHWHAIPTVRAFEAGKDVFVEKPLSYGVAEGRMMADAS